MRISKIVPGTLRHDPAEATTPSHRLLLRAGFVRQLTAGVYVYCHLGLRILQKIEHIVRKEMDRAGAVEVLLPILHPRGIWEETKRWGAYSSSGTFFTTRDRNGQDLALAPTAEEVITWLVRESVTSWRQLPFNMYQIGPKFRNEMRPRSGVIRGREFVMKDAYSFDVNEEGMRGSYAAMRDAYNRVFERCGLRFRMVEADSGAIGGTGSAEFMVLADTGEDYIISCECGYGANQEKAVSRFSPNNETEGEKSSHLESTPNTRTVDQLTALFGMPASQMVKTIIYVADGKPIAVCMRGDQQINEVKLGNMLGAASVELADDSTVQSVTDAEVGFAGPIGLTIPIYFDESVRGLRNFLCGGNQTDMHWLDVNLGRDIHSPSMFYDLRKAQPGDICSQCGQRQIGITKGIEVGHIFQLGTKYSEAMRAVFTDADSQERTIHMGCYGIGVSRIMAASIEQNHDEKGMVWPEALAPYEAVIIPATPERLELATQIYDGLLSVGFAVMLDDRDERAGVKFNDADLIGLPYQIIVGRKVVDGLVEVKNRRTGERRDVPIAEIAQAIRSH